MTEATSRPLHHRPISVGESAASAPTGTVPCPQPAVLEGRNYHPHHPEKAAMANPSPLRFCHSSGVNRRQWRLRLLFECLVRKLKLLHLKDFLEELFLDGFLAFSFLPFWGETVLQVHTP